MSSVGNTDVFSIVSSDTIFGTMLSINGALFYKEMAEVLNG